jgi:hypothetical protein
MPVFTREHYREIAKLLGSMNEPDQLVQLLTDKFGEFFEKDSEKFNFKNFQSAVTREREGR